MKERTKNILFGLFDLVIFTFLISLLGAMFSLMNSFLKAQDNVFAVFIFISLCVGILALYGNIKDLKYRIELLKLKE